MDIGVQINELREQKNISLEALALGICTAESLRNIELGKESVNKLFMEILFQRLGKSTDKLELILSEEVYEEELLLEHYEELLEQGDGVQAYQVLEQFAEQAPPDNKVHQMFYCRSRAYAEFRVENNPQQAKEWMQKALDITMPGWMEKRLEEYWISTIEMENLLAYAKALSAIGTKAELETAESLLLACKRFIDGRVTDGEEHAKIFAKCACLLGSLYVKQGKKEQAGPLAERGFNGLREYGISYYMEPLLHILVSCVSGENKEKNLYQSYLTAIRHLKQFVGMEQHFTDSIFKNCSQQTYYLDYELFREERIAQGYTQDQMIEGVYKNPESLSRAERGKVTMRDSKLIRLFHRLGIDKSRYNGFVVTDDYAVLELKQQVDILLSRNCDKEAEEKLEDLKQKLDLSIAENRRTILGYEISIGIEKEGIPKENLLRQAKDLLEETYRIQSHGVYRSPMDREASLINQIGILLQELGRAEEAKQLLGGVTEAMQKSEVSTKRRSKKYSLLRSNLAKWEQSISLAKNNLQFTIACGKLRTLPIDYMTIACALIDNPANYEVCREMIRDAYFLFDLIQSDANKNIVLQYYYVKYGELL